MDKEKDWLAFRGFEKEVAHMFIELSYTMNEKIVVYPDSPREEFESLSRMRGGDECNATLIKHFLHNGTHVDSPFHFYDKGNGIDKIPIEDFVYEKPLLIHKELRKSEFLNLEDLKKYGEALDSADILLFFTGYGRLWEDESVYADDWPVISEETARFIRTELLNVKAVAIDTLSIESVTLGPKTNFQVHKTLLDGELYNTRPLLIYESVNLERILHKTIHRIYAFPLRLERLEASPVNMVAEVMG